MDRQIKMCLRWIHLYEETSNAGLTCRRCGISRPTLRLWVRRWKEQGIKELAHRSRRPHGNPNRKRLPELEGRILQMRKRRNPGARRIRSELLHEDEHRLSLATVHKVLSDAQVGPLKRLQRRKHSKRHSRPIPDERVQMDNCKISSGIDECTSVDDCTRCRVLLVYPRRTAANTLDFIDTVVEEIGFPIQRFLTDRDGEFFAYEVQ